VRYHEDTMSDNVLQTIQQLVQDVIAPDVRELKVRVSSLEKQMDVRFDAVEKQMDTRFKAVDTQFEALNQKGDAQFKAILAAIAESKAQTDLTTFRLVAALSERVAVLESQRH
jgi:capsule polysaccharide export protein KpsE/RkpR